MWKFEICDDWNVIWSKEYQQRWQNLLDISPNTHVFFHPSLVRAWIETYLPLRNISPLFVWGQDYENGNEAFIPLVLWKRNWKNAFLHTIVPVGYSDYHNPIMKYQSVDMSVFWGTLISRLKSYSPDVIIIEGITDSWVDSEHDWKQDEPCPYMNLSNISTSEELLAFFRTSLRGDIRRQIRRLEELGQLSFKEYASFHDMSSIFPDFMREHSLKWPNAYKAPHFHETLLNKGLGVTTHFSSLNIDDKPIAWHLGFEYQGVFYYYMPAGNHEYAKFSPVKIHLYYLMCRAIEQGHKIYDHLRGEENYKSGWSNGLNYVNTLIVNNSSLVSQLKIKLNQTVRRLLK